MMVNWDRQILPVLCDEDGMGRLVVYGILLAAGSGSRFGQKKQYMELAGVPVWRRSLDALVQAGVAEIWLVVPQEDSESMRMAEGKHALHVVVGGETRSHSVQAGLRAISDLKPGLQPNDCILIHDAARPFVDPKDVTRVVTEAKEHGAAILAHPSTDTVKRVDDGVAVMETIPRQDLVLAETPQVFWWAWVKEHYLKSDEHHLSKATDDAWMMEQAGKTVRVVLACEPNLKITRKSDWEYAQWLANQRWGGN